MENKKKHLYPLVVGLLVTGIISCGLAFFIEYGLQSRSEGEVVTDNRSVQGFDKIVMEGTADITIVQGNVEGLVVRASSDKIKGIKSEVKNGTLYLDETSRRFPIFDLRFFGHVKYELIVKDLHKLTTKGTGSVRIVSLTTDNFEIVQEGMSNVEIDKISTADLSISIKGTGSIEIAGRATEQNIRIEGLGSYEALDLQSSKANVSIMGAGSANVWVIDELIGNIKGLGSVEYYGNPSTSLSREGLGSFDKVDHR